IRRPGKRIGGKAKAKRPKAYQVPLISLPVAGFSLPGRVYAAVADFFGQGQVTSTQSSIIAGSGGTPGATTAAPTTSRRTTSRPATTSPPPVVDDIHYQDAQDDVE